VRESLLDTTNRGLISSSLSEHDMIRRYGSEKVGTLSKLLYGAYTRLLIRPSLKNMELLVEL